jgi:branched-chain amino acid transport system ATP-binding protein
LTIFKEDQPKESSEVFSGRWSNSSCLGVPSHPSIATQRNSQRKTQLAGTLSGGEQQMLAIGRGLMSRTTLLMLDEPSLGLSPLLVKTIFKIIREINQQGMTLLLVEQNVFHSLRLSHQGYVLENGSVVLSGTGQELLKNEHIRQSYLWL